MTPDGRPSLLVQYLQQLHANVAAWPNTVEKVKAGYPNVKLIVPGHGAYGSKKLLDDTIRLFKPKE